MTSDFTMELLNSALQQRIEEFRANGLSDSEIVNKISELNIEDALMKVSEVMASDTVDLMERTMFERILEERTKTAQFMAHNEQIWGKGFVASEAMYIVSLELAHVFNGYVASLPHEDISDKQFRYVALCAIHGRACQQFLEILHLLKNGFADAAYARWRSIYELSVIAEFISKNGEDVAKAYCEAANTDDDYHDWAKAAPFFARNKHVSFDNIKRKCATESDAWRGQYKLSNKVVHASPQGTFGRLANGPGIERLIPVGHSDYGLAMPAVNSAISLSIISTYFFNSIPYGDGLVFIQIIQKWTDIIRKYYSDIESSCFEVSDDATGKPSCTPDRHS